MPARRTVPLAAAAVDAARDRAIPLAIANSREEAQRLAAAGGLTLGPLVSVSAPPPRPVCRRPPRPGALPPGPLGWVPEPQPSPFFGGPLGAAYGAEGTFGPGKFCGQIRTPIRRRNAEGRLAAPRGGPPRS